MDKDNKMECTKTGPPSPSRRIRANKLITPNRDDPVYGDTSSEDVRYTPLGGRGHVGTQTEISDYPHLPSLGARARGGSALGRLSTPMFSGMPTSPHPGITKVPYNSYYQRICKSGGFVPQAVVQVDGSQNKYSVAPGPPVVRCGRLGAPWRHIRQCTGNMGNHLCFVDGVVKQEDIGRFPPYGYIQPTESYAYITPRLMQARRSTPAETRLNPKHQGSSFERHAKQNFKYWYDDAKPVAAPKQTIQGRMMKYGVSF